MEDREPVIAGRFYSNNRKVLESNLSKHFEQAIKPEKYENVVSIISPHAGYVYSGDIAAKAFSQVDPNKQFDNIFIIAPSHHCSFNGASIYNIGNYKTPLGEVLVNRQLANKLINENISFSYYKDAHAQEHSLEVQVPFIQYWMNTDVQIIPIIMGTKNELLIENLAAALKPYFNNKNLFVFSTDFSHFPNYDDAVIADGRMGDAIISNSIKSLHKTESVNNKIEGLSTSACGMSGLLLLANLTKNNKEFSYHKIAYANSGDIHFGDKSRVVGYWAISVVQSNEMNLLKSDKEVLLEIARRSIKKEESTKMNHNDLNISTVLNEKCGVFISVYIANKLRGCIGRFKSSTPLYELVAIVARQSAYNDSRFNKITEDELLDLKIEISVLSPFKEINSAEEIELGTHGIYIKQGVNSGTFLPQVATKTGWNKEEFLGHCSKDKAGIGWDGWRNAELYTYTATIFKG